MATRWLCRLHNIINRDTGNEEFECTPIGLDMVYLKNCGDCQVKKKPAAGDGSAEDEVCPACLLLATCYLLLATCYVLLDA